MFNFVKSRVPGVTVNDVKKSLDANDQSIIIDVRTPQEYDKGHIASSRNIPVDEIKQQVLSKIPDKKKKIFVYCLSGSRSVIAVNMMIQLGYTHVFDVYNGLLAWRARHYPLEQ